MLSSPKTKKCEYMKAEDVQKDSVSTISVLPTTIGSFFCNCGSQN